MPKREEKALDGKKVPQAVENQLRAPVKTSLELTPKPREIRRGGGREGRAGKGFSLAFCTD